ncbi:MAG TPA: long-chain-fatty-acid--CoA ligase, partial [Dokdonella sp.]
MSNPSRPWLASYPNGIPAEIDPGQYRSVSALLEECCDRFRHRPAFTNMGREMSYGDLDRLSAIFAA